MPEWMYLGCICSRPGAYPREIYTEPENKVWYLINRLTKSEHKERITGKRFFGLQDHIDKLTKSKLIHNAENTSNDTNTKPSNSIKGLPVCRKDITF